MNVFTLGRGNRSHDETVAALRQAGVEQVIDVRPRQAAGNLLLPGEFLFSLWEFEGKRYRHEPVLVPSAELWRDLKSNGCRWDEFVRRFLLLIEGRGIEHTFTDETFRTPTALLGGRKKPDQCHRRLVLDYLRGKGLKIEPVHL